MDFATQYTPHKRIFHHPGNPEKIVYTPKYDATGNFDLVPTGKEDLYGYIQSFAESTDIHVILERFASGDVDVLSRTQGFWADASTMPKTYAEVLNAVIAGETAFDHLPVEIKQQFGNSFAVWLSSMETPEWAEKMGFDSHIEETKPQAVPVGAGSASAASETSVSQSAAPASDGGVKSDT